MGVSRKRLSEAAKAGYRSAKKSYEEYPARNRPPKREADMSYKERLAHEMKTDPEFYKLVRAFDARTVKAARDERKRVKGSASVEKRRSALVQRQRYQKRGFELDRVPRKNDK